ncbi:MAG: hypothetical protein KGJ07_06495 [Patescibacteria group bacterium]|nr:hypothetical protein [Patescibacteria group bacterium]
MSFLARISLAGYNALTDTNPDHYALFCDQDNVLIKEKARGSGSLSYTGSTNINHGLSYIPMFLFWGDDSSGNLIYGGLTNTFSAANEWDVNSDTSNLNITQLVDMSSRNYQYFIFYDKLS